MRRVRLLTDGEIEGDRVAREIRLQLDFRRETAARPADRLKTAKLSKNASKTPDLLNRSKRFHTLFHLLKRSGSALPK